MKTFNIYANGKLVDSCKAMSYKNAMKKYMQKYLQEYDVILEKRQKKFDILYVNKENGKEIKFKSKALIKIKYEVKKIK